MEQVNMSPIRSINRAIDVLQTFTSERIALTIDDITQMTTLPKSTVYRILVTLKLRGFIEFDSKTLLYKPGLRLMEFGFLLPLVLDVQKEAEEILNTLHRDTEQTVMMAVKEGHQIAYTFKKEIDHGLKFSSSVGQRRSFLFGVLGPPILAFLEPSEVDEILEGHIKPPTPNSVTDKTIILHRLEATRRNGYYIESNETHVGVTGIGCPIFNQKREPIAGIGIIGPSVQMDSKLDQWKPLILNASTEISKRMGYTESL